MCPQSYCRGCITGVCLPVIVTTAVPFIACCSADSRAGKRLKKSAVLDELDDVGDDQ